MKNLYKKVSSSYSKRAFSVQPIEDITSAPVILEVFFEHLLRKYGKIMAKEIVKKLSLLQPTRAELKYLYGEFLKKEGKRVIKVYATETQGLAFLSKGVNKFLFGNPFSRDEAKLSIAEWSQALEKGKVSPHGKTFGEIEYALLEEFRKFLVTATPLFASWKLSNYIDEIRSSIISSFEKLFQEILNNAANSIQANYYQSKRAFFGTVKRPLDRESVISVVSETLKAYQPILQKEVMKNLSAKKVEDVLKGVKKINSKLIENSVDNHFISWVKGSAKTQSYTTTVEELPFKRF